MMHRRLTACLLVIALGAATAAKKPFWEEKPPETWSKQECVQLLTNSPWVSQWPPGRVPGAGFSGTYQAQLWSVRLIRQAMVRFAQLDPGYPLLTPEARKTQDEEGARFTAAEFPDTIVVQVRYLKKDPQWVWFWRSQTVASLQQIAYLGMADRNVAPAGYTPPTLDKAEMQFVFPRFLRGQPLTQPADALLGLQLQVPSFAGRMRETILIRFEPQRMLVEGKLAS